MIKKRPMRSVVTSDLFVLFIDMVIVERYSGCSWLFAEIALYTEGDAKITEERYFHDRHRHYTHFACA